MKKGAVLGMVAMAAAIQGSSQTTVDNSLPITPASMDMGYVPYEVFHVHGDAIFIPKKHTKLSYSAQNRAAKKRRNNKQVR